jgi:hypothetical protein
MDPFKLLKVDQTATKKEIIQAAALAMRERKYDGKQIAVAQKELLDPVKKATQAFIHFLDVSPLKHNLNFVKPETIGHASLEYIDYFGNKT